MSTYQRQTKNPLTGDWQVATWIDDYYGNHRYGVEFPNGDIFNADTMKLETREEEPKQQLKNELINNIVHARSEENARKAIDSYTKQVLYDDRTNSFENTILHAYPSIRQIVFHSDGSVAAKTGGGANHPKKLYTIRPKNGELPHYGEMASQAVKKLIADNI